MTTTEALSVAYLGLRLMALGEGKREEDKKGSKQKVCTLVVDIPIRPGRPITMALRRNGECSLYAPHGGGFIGCHRYPKVKQATKLALSIVDALDLSSFTL